MTMSRVDRNRAAKLEAIMARHERWEKRTLADLRTAGFERVFTIDDARDRLAAQRSLPDFSQRQIDIAMYAIEKAKRDRRKRHAEEPSEAVAS